MLTETLKVFEGETLEKYILKPLDTLITNINKYSVLPIYVCNFIINKETYIPSIVLIAYDDRALITEISASNAQLEATLLDKTPATVYPTVAVYQNDIPEDVVINKIRNDLYLYSSSFIVYGKNIKDAIKMHLIENVVIKSDCNKENVEVFINGSFDESGVILKIPSSAKVIRLPLTNYIEKHKSYNNILKLMESTETSNDNLTTITDNAILDKLFKDVKEEQSCLIPNTRDVLIFKDFMKQKPLSMQVYYCKDNDTIKKLGLCDSNSNIRVVTVALKMVFNSKITHVVFYRYIENIVKKIIGNYEEL